MTKLPTSLVAIVALTGCTAAFLTCTDASAFTRFAGRQSFAPRFAGARTSVPSFRPATGLTLSRFAHVPFQNSIGRGFPTLNNAAVHFPRPSSIGGGFPHIGTIGGGFPRQNSIAGNFPSSGSIGRFPRAGMIGGGFSRANTFAGNFPRPGTIGGFPHSGSSFGSFSHPNGLATSAGSPTTHQTLGHGFSIGDIPIIGPAVGAATKTVGDVASGKIQNVPGDIISGPGKVVTGTIGQLTPKPASTSEPQGSTTSDASGFNTGKPSMVQTALLLKRINDMKAAAAASNPGKPSMVQTALLLKRINDIKAAQQASATKTTTPPVNTTNTTTTSNTTTSKHPGQVFCIVAPCPVIHPGSPSSISGIPGSDLRPPVIVNVGSVGGASGFPVQAQPIAASASSYQAVAYQPTPSPVFPAPGSLGTPVTAAQTPNVTDATPSAATSNPMFVFVAFQKDVAGTDLATFLQAYKVSIVEGPNADGLYKLQLAEPLTPEVFSQMIDSMKGQTGVVASVSS